jgi:hypothetical protein
MWMLIDRKWRYTFLVALVLIIAIIYAAFAFYARVPSSLEGITYRILTSVFSAIGTATLLITFLGGRQFLWRIPLRLPGMKAILKFPDVNGVWAGPRHSSYLEDKAKRTGSPAPGENIIRDGNIIRLIIRQSWLKVEVETRSPHGRTVSHSVNAFPEFFEKEPAIMSIYRARVRNPGPTESQTHTGGAVLNIREENNGDLCIFGTYFSDRGTGHDLPSSGSFTVWRYTSNPNEKPTAEKLDDFVGGKLTPAQEGIAMATGSALKPRLRRGGAIEGE